MSDLRYKNFKYEAFSVVEALVVIIILVVISSLSVSYFMDLLEKHKLKNQVIMFVEDILYAESLASKRGGSVLEINGNGYKISSKGKVYLQREIPKWINFSCSSNRIEFLPNTLPRTEVSCVFSANTRFVVRVDNISGRVIWKEK